MPVSIERGGGGWDLGPDGSITEDAVYVLKAIERKCKFGWVSVGASVYVCVQGMHVCVSVCVCAIRV